MSKIVNIEAREVIDTLGVPTVEVCISSEKGNVSTFVIPSFKSKSMNENIFLRDKEERYDGKGCLKAVENINKKIGKKLIGMDSLRQKEIDEMLISLDKSENRKEIGGNTLFGVSIACLKLGAMDAGKEVYEHLNPKRHRIPNIMVNLINGGVNSKNYLSFQEFMIVPKMDSLKENVRCACEVYYKLEEILLEDKLWIGIGDAGGFAPRLKTCESALEYLVKAIKKAGYKPGENVFLAIDADGNNLYDENAKKYKLDGKYISSGELLNYYLDIVKRYPIISIEDAFDENDLEGFKELSNVLRTELNLALDKIVSSKRKLLEFAVDEHICNSNVIGFGESSTFYEMLETIVCAKKNKYTTIMACRSSENLDYVICDICTALEIPFIKIGGVTRGERVIKYNRLMKLEEILENK